MNFETYSLIFLKFDDFKIFFKILRTLSIPIVRKMTLYNKIILQLRETVYIRIDYTGLSKSRSFIMIKIYLTTSNIILDSTTPKIVILVNLIKKALKINKDIYIATIYKYIDIIYFMINSFRVFVILTTALTAISELSSLI